MKIVALLPVKNEAWILSAYLSSVSKVADEIIALNDGSVDDSARLLAEHGAVVETFETTGEARLPMSSRREKLLTIGRRRGGTHFIWLDADEAFTAPFLKEGRQIISQLRPGQKLSMQWLALWKDGCKYRDDASVWSRNFKDFVVCDRPDYGFDQRFLSEGRTQGPNDQGNLVKILPNNGAVLHFQFVPWQRFQMKQAWYRCLELVNAPQSADEINATYSITLDDKSALLKEVPGDWLEGIEIPEGLETLPPSWHRTEIIVLFDRHGIEFFEPLQIWHIQDLEEEFVRRTSRLPRRVKSVSRLRDRFRTQASRLKGALRKWAQ